MKEINKFSELMNFFLLDIEKKMMRENKDIQVYEVWDEIMKKENLSALASLEDIKDSSLIVYVKHPGVSQQIRLKSKKILSIFKEKFPALKLKKISVVLKDNL